MTLGPLFARWSVPALLLIPPAAPAQVPVRIALGPDTVTFAARLEFDDIRFATRVDTVTVRDTVWCGAGGSCSPIKPAVGVPFGPSGGVGVAALSEIFSHDIEASQASTIVDRIAAVRARGHTTELYMTGGAATQYLTDGRFDLAKWKARQSTYDTPAIRDAIAQGVADGVIVGNRVMDEPFNPKWGGGLTKAVVDQMCAYAKTLFPTLPEGVVHDYDDFEPTKDYAVCDYYVSQYRSAKGSVAAFRDSSLAHAARSRMAVAFSLNVLDGGLPDRDGTWDCTNGSGGKGYTAPNCQMTAAQIVQFGLVLGPAGCSMMLWRYDPQRTEFTRAANLQAFRDVGAVLRAAAWRGCGRG